MTRNVTRRELISGALPASLVLLSPAAQTLVALPGPYPSRVSAPTRPIVAISRRDGMLDKPAGRIDLLKMRACLAAAICSALEEPTPVEGFRKLFKPSDIVGIKVNCLAGRNLSSRPEVAFQIASWLEAAGILASRIVIWDRTTRDLRLAGYTPGSSGPHIVGTDGDYEEVLREWGPSGSRFARVLTENITALINLGVLKDHGLAGVSLGMKNWFGAVHNPNKLHEDGCNPFVPHLAGHPLIQGKLRLTIIDATTGQCHGGPGYSPSWAWPFQGFLASADPVALDAVGYRIIEARRRDAGLPTLASEGREPRYIMDAEKLGLGTAQLPKIELRRV